MSKTAAEPLGKKLLQDVAAKDLRAVEKTLSGKGNVDTLQRAIKYSIPISSVMDTVLRGMPLVHKLMEYDINCISAFHLAALQGQNEVIVTMLDKLAHTATGTQDLPVDMRLESETTGLHLAAFAGRVDTVKLLLEVYRAQVNLQDKYGWTALHYASTEGQIEVVKTLLDHGADIDLRDKDGTSAAWRAQVNKHQNIVALLCARGDEEDLLNVDNMDDSAVRASLYGVPTGDTSPHWTTKPEPNVPDGLYSTVQKPNSTIGAQGVTQSKRRPHQYEEVDDAHLHQPPRNQMEPVPGYEWVDPKTGYVGAGPPISHPEDRVDASSSKGLLRHKSVPDGPRPHVHKAGAGMSAGVTNTLPTGFREMSRDVRKSTVRRIIRNELEAVFSDYETPQNVLDGGVGGGGGGGGAAGAGAEGEGIGDVARAGVGMGTLRGIMREEMDRFRRENLGGAVPGGGGGGVGAAGAEWEDNEDYEPLYETLGGTMPLTPPPPPPGKAPPSAKAPPLPPPRQSAPGPTDQSKPDPPAKNTKPTAASSNSSNRNSVITEKPRPSVEHLPRPASARLPQTTNNNNNNNVKQPSSNPTPQAPARKLSGMVMLAQQAPTSMALQYSVSRLSQVIGTDWKKLARALPIDRRSDKCIERIAAIEKQYPTDEAKAAAALGEWRINAGKDATVDDVIIALRKCALHNLIGEVEQVASEFTA